MVVVCQQREIEKPLYNYHQPLEPTDRRRKLYTASHETRRYATERRESHVKSYPPPDTGSKTVLEGHLWLLEKIDGVPFRFQLEASGRLRFGDRNRVYKQPETVPERHQHAVRHIQTNLDREALRAAVPTVENIVFFGVVTTHQRIPYDWHRIPSFLGFDVWSAETGQFRPPDATKAIFERLGLAFAPVIEQELPARDFDPQTYTIPTSVFSDGPADGIVIRNKTGGRMTIENPEVGPEADSHQQANDGEETTASATALAERYAPTERFDTVATSLEAAGKPVTTETLFDRVLESILREHHHRLDGVEMAAFRSELGALTQTYCSER